MMNLLSEAKAEEMVASARLEYRALGAEELQTSYPLSGERRRMERRAVPQDSAARRGVSDAAWQEAVKAARAEGFVLGEREGRIKTRLEMEGEMRAVVARERERLEGTVADFVEAKERYFAEIEGQVVRLALAIAGRVLHRETQMDALVLGGAVRVALEKLSEKSGVVLRTAVSDVEAWEEMFAEAEHPPKVQGDARLRRGDCVMETAMGTVELGVETQLEEIEKGFFDLLRSNPASWAAAARA